jgi:hypothetical protein
VSEAEFMRRLMLALGRRADMRIWRQNVGSVPVRDERGGIVRVFHAGVPKGAGDISGFVRPEGWRLEIEVKGPGGALRPEQERFARLVATGGCVYVLARYDTVRSLSENLALSVGAVDEAIARRRAR